MIAIAILLLIFNIEKCSTDLSVLNKIRKLIGRDIKDKSLKGTFKTVMYLGSKVKISCYGSKSPTQIFREFSWYHAGKRISNNKRYAIDKYGVLTIHEVLVEDSGAFICATNSKRGLFKFKHEVTVVQLPSKSLHVHFVYAVRFCTEESVEFARRFIESKVKEKVCLGDKCQLSYIHSNCQFQEFANPSIKITVPVLLPGVPNGNCNVECSREGVENAKEEVKQKVVSAVMQGRRLKIREEPREMSISYLETEEDDICKPGFEMKGTHSRSLCIPCSPGQFLEKGYCIPCHLNHYNGKYAATECQACFSRRVTRSRGSVSEEDCYVSDPNVIWILLVIFLIAVPVILACCCWSFVKLLGESLAKCLHILCSYMICCREFFSRPEQSKSAKEKKRQGSKHSKSIESLQRTADISSHPKTAVSFAIPSARHSTAKNFFYKTPQASYSNVPEPPALPTNSTPIRPPKNTVQESSGDAELGGTKDSKQRNNLAGNNMKSIFPQNNAGDLPHYPERILRNPAMYNAIKKSFG